MTVDAFLSELQADLEQKKNAHRMGKPATDSQIAAWQKKQKRFALWPDHIKLLKRHNGLAMYPDQYTPGVFRVLPLSKMKHVARVLYGAEATEGDEAIFGETYLGIGEDDNGDWAAAMDTATGKCYIVGPSDEEFDDLDGLLDWVHETFIVPHREDARAEKERAAHAKGSGKAVKPLTMTETRVFRAGGKVEAIALSPDGRWLAAGTRWENSGLRLWKIESGEKQHELTPAFKLLDGHDIYGIAWNPLGTRVLAATHDRTFVVDPETGSTVQQFAPGLTVDFAPDGRLCWWPPEDPSTGTACFTS